MFVLKGNPWHCQLASWLDKVVPDWLDKESFDWLNKECFDWLDKECFDWLGKVACVDQQDVVHFVGFQMEQFDWLIEA